MLISGWRGPLLYKENSADVLYRVLVVLDSVVYVANMVARVHLFKHRPALWNTSNVNVPVDLRILL